MAWATWRRVASEQLPDSTRRRPLAIAAIGVGRPSAARMPKLAGRPMAIPDPPVTSGAPASALPSETRC